MEAASAFSLRRRAISLRCSVIVASISRSFPMSMDAGTSSAVVATLFLTFVVTFFYFFLVGTISPVASSIRPMSLRSDRGCFVSLSRYERDS